ncbi:MAG: ABC transporter permease [Deferribacterales bacterium]|nr:ABC transporter permease [Deferribacterales bacterium]
MYSTVKEIFNYSEMLKSIVKKDLRTRYRGSVLGFLWTFLNPMLQLTVYAIVFPYVLRFNVENYAVFLFVCLIPYAFFQTTVLLSCGLIINNANIVTKLYFPRIILPLGCTISGLINMFLTYLIVIPMLLFFDIPMTWNLLWLFFLFLVQTVMCAGLAMLFSAINVYFRDTEHIMGIITMALHFLSPILYGIEMLPEKLQFWIKLNPLTGLFTAYRDVVFYGKSIIFSNMMIYSIVCSFVIFIVGFVVFQKLQRNFAEVV